MKIVNALCGYVRKYGTTHCRSTVQYEQSLPLWVQGAQRPRPNLLARASHELLVSLHVNGPAPSLLHISSGTVRPSIHL
ncbi:hypothetical protein MCOR02_001555 [Pyricularia oryzae]|uniref:Uncharacterized protein n=3 Tax=Pyricularia TaxID=48558 RepID=A0ABQ8NCH3_PYRGI|nr:hypothetical protein OOU_Y34scaffold00194g112 [Pyricularia oryzae Y34]KAH9437911.1 hypothetical protein MCOR02_001555 [Pyricularia oryzae]KAI6294447.1 hypothetical protein MCOR33_008421 [Pyricularia grisea]KAI6269493.1 hypothetical protein MCOR26_008706 [Pyricularia oryzae]KAI6364574.1 hypothetical protein MCOR31_007319 [Pyricularia oryzae]